MPSDLVTFWGRCDLTAPPHAHPDDLPVLSRGSGKYIDAEPRTFESFVASGRFGDFTDHRLHLSLLPIPYGGNLAHADIIVLLLNPGFSYTDYYGEMRMPAFNRRLRMNLSQSFEGVEFPFLWLDPEFCWHGGFVWWEKKLREIITLIAAERFKGRYLDALRNLSTRLAHIELVPYHSPSFRGHALINDLPSVNAARRFVQDALVSAAQAGSKTIIVTRQEAAWGLPKPSEHLVIYKGGQTRGASLGPDTPGGKAILKRYGIETLAH
ncbi:MAG: hypothetical protein WD674_10670 [Cucumibacter sp.]